MGILLIRVLYISFVLFFSQSAISKTDPSFNTSEGDLIVKFLQFPDALINEMVQDNFDFYGLASYYNNVDYYILDINSLTYLDDVNDVELKANQKLVVVGRFNVLLLKAPGLLIGLKDSKLSFKNIKTIDRRMLLVQIITKSELVTVSPEFDKIRYAHLWPPLAWLAKLIEASIIALHNNISSNWCIVILLLAIILRLLLLPVSIMTIRFQQRVGQIQTKLEPLLDEIKTNYDGEEAHNRLMAAHKELGVSPFYPLKPMLSSFIQIPILICLFNVLGEMPQFDGQSFMWIDNIAYPDFVGHLSSGIPMFGDKISILPLIMTVLTIFSTVFFQNQQAPKSELKRQKRNLYAMAILFFVLFYPFPAVVVAYWTLANVLQFIEQRIIRI